MTQSLKESLFYVLLLPILICSLMLWAGAGIFSFIATFIFAFAADRIVKKRKAAAIARDPSLAELALKFNLTDKEVLIGRVATVSGFVGGLAVAGAAGMGMDSPIGAVVGMFLSLIVQLLFLIRKRVKQQKKALETGF